MLIQSRNGRHPPGIQRRGKSQWSRNEPWSSPDRAASITGSGRQIRRTVLDTANPSG